MVKSIDTAVIAATVTAPASVLAAALTYMIKSITEFVKRRRESRMHLMQVRNELAINHGLAKAICAHTRTFGTHFIDRAWTICDTSSIYRSGIPSEKIHDVYSAIQIFNTLNDRYILIAENKGYGPNKDNRLSNEHAEMVTFAENVVDSTKYVLQQLK